MKIIKLPTGTFDYDPSKPLGRKGGFGQVFAGRSSTFGEVAVKKLHLSAADAAHRELRIADELKGRSFEHVIPFIDAGEDADTGDYFVVMPRADGSLQNKVEKGGTVATTDAAAILLQIVKGLTEVGDLVHRDLKPDNVLFHKGKWKIADFGIARFVQDATASDTLKDCLSPHYAAPEQWRSERATHASDVYSVGAIAFCLLTGKPPFLANPSEEHQSAPVPPFECSDSRLSSLTNMMLRKNPATRPALSRVQELLAQIVAKPAKLSDGSSLAALADASAHVADLEQQLQAQQRAEAAAREERLQLAKGGFEILTENVERLWGKIHAHAPNAERFADDAPGIFQCRMGKAWLGISSNQANYVEPGSFPHSGWDVVGYSEIAIGQNQPPYRWSASLWFMKPKQAEQYRWYEVAFYSLLGRSWEPTAELVGRDTDLAACNLSPGMRVAFGPCLIDDEDEEKFHERWIWLLSKASTGKLQRPFRLPFTWPPPM